MSDNKECKYSTILPPELRGQIVQTLLEIQMASIPVWEPKDRRADKNKSSEDVDAKGTAGKGAQQKKPHGRGR